MFSSNRRGRKAILIVGLLMTLFGPAAGAEQFAYTGDVNFCAPTCNNFPALGGKTGGSDNSINSEVRGTINLPVQADGTFTVEQSDNVIFSFSFTNPDGRVAVRPFGRDRRPSSALLAQSGSCSNATNPLLLADFCAVVSGFGTIDANGQIDSGSLTFAYVGPPLGNNNMVVRIDLSNGTGEGEVLGVIVFFRMNGTFSTAVDVDADGVIDADDNCVESPNANQRDADGDGFGSLCDADINNDCVVNAQDLGLFRNAFFTNDADADFNGDNIANVTDLGILRSAFFQPPGPSGPVPVCGAR